ncbi:MAG: universal stress protein [Polyangiales bacterium]
MALSKIIVGVDFSPKTDRAMRSALVLAQACNAKVVLVHVVPSLAEIRGSDDGDGTVTATIEKRLQEQAAVLSTNTGVSVDYGVVVGPSPAEEIVKYVSTWGGDIIVTGTEGRTGLDRILIGSVAEKLVQSAPVPVLVVGPNVA